MNKQRYMFGQYHTCEHCGKKFFIGCTITDYVYKEGNKWFCSYSCHTNYLTHICKECGKKYEYWKNHRGFCSKGCRQKYYSDRDSKERYVGIMAEQNKKKTVYEIQTKLSKEEGYKTITKVNEKALAEIIAQKYNRETIKAPIRILITNEGE